MVDSYYMYLGPLRGIPSQNPGKMSSGFTTASKMYNRPSVTKKEGGAKVKLFTILKLLIINITYIIF